MSPFFDPEGKLTLVTGCSQATGPARAEGLAARGAGVMLPGVAVFPGGKASPFINGHMLYVDGGITTSL